MTNQNLNNVIKLYKNIHLSFKAKQTVFISQCFRTSNRNCRIDFRSTILERRTKL